MKESKDPRYCSILGIEYNLPWDHAPPGSSFFLPTIADPKEVAEIIRGKARRVRVPVEVRQRCEFGVLGVRVWIMG